MGASAGTTGGASTRQTFIQSTAFSGALWTLPTLALAIAAPLLILIALPNYRGATAYVFPLLLQSIGIGLGVGIGPSLRAMKQIRYSIVSQLTAIALVVPIGLLLVALFGSPGVSWLVGVIELGQVAAMSAVIIWLTRPLPVSQPG